MRVADGQSPLATLTPLVVVATRMYTSLPARWGWGALRVPSRRYFGLMHQMAEDSNSTQDSTRLNATLAYMYAYLKEFMMSVQDANQSGDFCAEQMQLSGITCSRIFTRGAHIGACSRSWHRPCACRVCTHRRR